MAQSVQSVVEAVGLRKVFKDFWGRPKAAAVNGIDLQIRQGEVVGFLGPNGSGKSTTVKMILGLLYPTAGSLTTFGKSPSHVQTKQRVGYLPEETYLYKYLTAAETLDFFGALFNLPSKVRRERSEQLLEQVGLGHAADRPVGEFSKGMVRRIGLAQALINDPEVIILDEPTAGLDPIGCRDVKNIIRLLASRNKTVILCSHLLADVEDVCDAVMIMYGGKIRARGKLEELLKVEDRTRIVTPTLEPEVLRRVMDVLNEAVTAEACQVDTPSMNLEEFFMDVVRQARADSVATAGVQAEGQIASFLSGAAGKSAEEVLAALATAEEQEATPAEEPPAPEPQPDVERLRTLAAEDEPEPAEEAADAEAAADASEDKQAANRKIEDLLKRD